VIVQRRETVRAIDPLTALYAEWRTACASRSPPAELALTEAGLAKLPPAEQVELLQFALSRLAGQRG
jgi:hypothetical protein